MTDRIQGDKINLRHVRKADARSIYKYASDEAISRFTHVPHPYKLEDAYDFIKLTRSERRRKIGYHFGLEDKETSQIIGMIGLMHVDHECGKGEVGYWLAKPFWGRGIMKEALLLALRFYFTELHLHRVYAHVFPENEVSMRLLEKVGFQREGLIREGFKQRGEYISVYMYSILEDDWARMDLSQGQK